MATRVLIIDGDPAVGRGLDALIRTIPGLEVVGLDGSVETRVRRALATPPDVALVDTELPELCSPAIIQLLRRRLPSVRIIGLGVYASRRGQALIAGAHDFLLKDAGFDALRAAIFGGQQVQQVEPRPRPTVVLNAETRQPGT